MTMNQTDDSNRGGLIKPNGRWASVNNKAVREEMAYSKYSAKPTMVDSIRFASKAEARRYGELKNLERAGVIKRLELQPEFPLSVNGALVCKYRADFAYFEKNARVIEDVKGFATDVYKLKKKLLLALHPALDFREIGGVRKAPGRNVTREVEEIFREEGRRRA